MTPAEEVMDMEVGTTESRPQPPPPPEDPEISRLRGSIASGITLTAGNLCAIGGGGREGAGGGGGGPAPQAGDERLSAELV